MRLFYPEWIGCLGKVHKPEAQVQGRKNPAAQARMIFPPQPARLHRPGAGEGRKAARPGLIFPDGNRQDGNFYLFLP